MGGEYFDATEALREFSDAAPTSEIPAETLLQLVTEDPCHVYTER